MFWRHTYVLEAHKRTGWAAMTQTMPDALFEH